MEITYLGHSSFKIKTKTGTLVTDPYHSKVGFAMPSVTADVVTVSHRGHGDHDEVGAVTGTARREKPFVIDQPGEYEVEGISVFGYATFHDNSQGSERGPNTIYVIQAENIRVLHLGDLGHILSDSLLDQIDVVDVLMIPVGGVYTIGPKEATELVGKIEPTYVLPMHFRSDKHDEATFGKLATAEEFIKQFEHGSRAVKSLNISRLSIPDDLTEVITFE